MHFKYYLALFISIFATATVFADAELKTEQQKLSYALGTSFALNVAQQNTELELDIAAFTQAVQDILGGSEPQLSVEEMQEIVKRYQATVAKELSSLIETNQKAGDAFLAENKTKDGVMELSSGLQYKVITQGDGKKPEAGSSVTVHYQGSLIDGTVFDSSYERGEPATFALSQVIQGWQEALPMMKEGGKWQIYVPANLAYGDRGAGQLIDPSSALVFDIELISANPQ